HTIFHPRAHRSLPVRLGTLEEAMPVLPAREGTPELDVHEAEVRVDRPPHPAPGRGQAGQAQGEVEEPPRLELSRRLGEPSRLGPRGLHGAEIARVDEECEYVGSRPGQPETPLDDVVGHDGRAMIGGCSVRVKPAPTPRCRSSPLSGARTRPSRSSLSSPFPPPPPSSAA